MKLRLPVVLAGAFVLALTSAASAADIVDTAAAAGHFQTLVAAVKAAGLVDTFERTRPVHGVRAHRRSLRQVTGRYGAKPAQAGEQG